MDRDTRNHRWETEADERERRRRSRRGRSGWKRPRRILGLWARLSLLLGVILVSVFIGIGLVAKAARPYREAGVQSSQLSATRRESDQLSAQNAALVRQIQYLKTSEGIASEARSYGYLRPGEQPIVVQGVTLPKAPRVPSAAAPVSPVGTARRFWQHLTGHGI